MQIYEKIFCYFNKKHYLCNNKLKDIHNKDYSVV